MHSTTCFDKLLSVGTKRLRRLSVVAKVALSAHSESHRDRQLGFVVIEAHNLWANFVRAYLLSLLAQPRRISGGRVQLANKSIVTPADLLLAAVRACKSPYSPSPTRRRDEPSWHDPATLLKTCGVIKPSNLAVVLGALSVPNSALRDLPTFRNFYAHRNEESARKALTLARTQHLIYGAAHPTDALSSSAKGRTQPLVLDWLSELEVLMELLCE